MLISTSQLTRSLLTSLFAFFNATFPQFGSAASQSRHTVIRVAAASSLKPVLDSKIEEFNQKKAAAGIKVMVSYGASGVLAKQIQQKAPYSLFISANKFYLRQSQKEKVKNEGVNIYRTSLVYISRKHASQKKPRFGLPNPKTAPFGLAAKACLKHYPHKNLKASYFPNAFATLSMLKSNLIQASILPKVLVHHLPSPQFQVVELKKCPEKSYYAISLHKKANLLLSFLLSELKKG